MASLKVESRFVGWAVIAFILLMTGLSVLVDDYKKKVLKSTDATLVAKNTQLLKNCLKDKPGCLGGYIKWPGGPVVRIANTTGVHSDFEIGMDSIEIKMSLEKPWFPSAIEYVALPDTAAWNEAVQEYGRQFVMYR